MEVHNLNKYSLEDLVSNLKTFELEMISDNVWPDKKQKSVALKSSHKNESDGDIDTVDFV